LRVVPAATVERNDNRIVFWLCTNSADAENNAK